jgi:hypothetical protein
MMPRADDDGLVVEYKLKVASAVATIKRTTKPASAFSEDEYRRKAP